MSLDCGAAWTADFLGEGATFFSLLAKPRVYRWRCAERQLVAGNERRDQPLIAARFDKQAIVDEASGGISMDVAATPVPRTDFEPVATRPISVLFEDMPAKPRSDGGCQARSATKPGPAAGDPRRETVESV